MLLTCIAIWGAPTIIFNGDTLLLSNEFKRKQCGTLKTSELLPEVSGIMCSRVTPGYLWLQSDEVEKSNQIVATTEKGDVCQVTLNLKLTHTRWDWEDLSGGIYQGKNYLFKRFIVAGLHTHFHPYGFYTVKL